jgi:hypothetical protein
MKFTRFVVVTSFLLLAMSEWTNASESRCINRLTNDYAQDSVTLRNYGNDHLAFSIKIIRNLLEDVGCSKAVINFGRSARGRSHNRCDQILRGVPNSRVCYIETNLGYFFVTKDMLTKVHVTFNRWD